ncbi:hypothetical protein OG730_34755 [Streptomyces sp. NBC_01298]|uniref:hypothetical protein n=1 Tax=Streptomyces sp. NBC_01298 TaxID=2903817 RepID=UPI002E14BE03|nr:hypothetical protein OG730_34755 [Streptomyces sp. NBC_01298]
MKPLADHGTTARAKGRPATGVKGCPCAPCRTAEAVYDKKRRVFNATGRTLMVDTAPVAVHLKELFDAGAGWNQIAAAAQSSTATVHSILTGRVTQCRRVTARKLLAVKAQDVIPAKRPVNACGSIRRMHALLALGHTNKAITIASGVEHSMLSDLINERLAIVTRHVAERIDLGFRTLAGRQGTSARSINRARRNNWAPAAAWDEESIDDPAAHPEWTGHCGTDRGFWTHRLQKILMCQPCEQAHSDWKTAHAHLEPRARIAAAHRARCAASNRGSELAEDGRELLRLGCSPDQAAERLGVTRQHLQQELCRHPETAKKAA